MNASTSDALRRGLRTFVIATLGIAIPGLFGWLNDLSAWASSNGQRPMPDWHNLTFLLVAAICAGFIAVLNIVWVLIENASGHAMLRNPVPPADPKNQEGIADVLLVVIVVIVVIILAGFLL